MPVHELTQWAGFERVNGPILPHDRIDIGLAQVAYYTVQMWSKSRVSFRDFLPRWFRPPASRKPEAVKAAFEQLLAIAEKGGGPYADDQQPRRPRDG